MQKCSVQTRQDGKGQFWQNLHEKLSPQTLQVKIFRVSGTDDPGRLVRTLKDDKRDGPFPVGHYKFYWDGKDDQGSLLPPGMYSYVLYNDARGGSYRAFYGQCMYLFKAIWPVPNEVKDGTTTKRN